MSEFTDEKYLDHFRTPAAPPSWSEGDRVLAPAEDGWLYPGTVGDARGQLRYIFFDMGKRERPAAELQHLDVVPGSRVYCRRDDVWSQLGATVATARGEQLQVEFDDGVTEWTVIAMIRVAGPDGAASPRSSFENDADYLHDWRVGDRVFARRGMWYYPGVIAEDNGESYKIAYDNGRAAWLPGNQIRWLKVAIGERIQCRWLGGGIFYTGTIQQRSGDQFFIHYDDGDREWNTVSMMRLPAGPWSIFLSKLRVLAVVALIAIGVMWFLKAGGCR